MSKHTDIKHKIQSVGSKVEFNKILNDSMLSDTEKEFMRLFYVERKDMHYIADTMGYSLNGVSKMHRRILKRIERLF